MMLFHHNRSERDPIILTLHKKHAQESVVLSLQGKQERYNRPTKRDGSSCQLLNLPVPPSTLKIRYNSFCNSQVHIREELAHLLGHAHTRIRLLDAQLHKPSHPMTTCSAVQTEPERFNSLVSSSPLSTASVLLQEPIPATPTNTVIPPDFHNSLHDDDDKDTLASDTSWETLTPSEFEALRDQWWHDFRFAEDLEPLDSPLKESRCRTGAGSPRPAATTRRRPLVTRIARPLYFDGLPWSTVEPVFIGPLGSECPARVGLVGVGTAGARAVGVARRSVDDAGERISRMPGRAWSKWRSFRDAKTRQVHRELILDRIDRAEHVNNEKDVEEAQEKEIVLVIEAGGDIDGGEGKTTGQDPWRDWAAMVRAHAIQGKSKENGPRQAFSSTLCEMRREEAIVEGVLYDLEKRHSKVRATRAIERRAFGANPIVHPGVVGTEYLRRVWDEAQIEQPEEEKEMK